MGLDRVLIIDNSSTARMLTQNILIRKGGYRDTQFFEAENGQEAFEMLNEMKELPDLVFTDVLMPILDGYRFIEKIRKIERFGGMPIIILSGMGTIASEAIKDDPRIVEVQKPITSAKLLEVVEQIL